MGNKHLSSKLPLGGRCVLASGKWDPIECKTVQEKYSGYLEEPPLSYLQC